MYKIIVWGIDEVYNKYKNIVDFEVMKKNFEIVAMVSKDKFADYIDGIKVISTDNISKHEYDYVVVFANAFDEIKHLGLSLGIKEEHIIDGQVFGIPCFDFCRYVSLIENPVTIISDDCWGGLVYKYLHLKATSPFINFWISNNDFIRLCKNLNYYLEQPLKKENEGTLERCFMPTASLGQGEEKIYFNFNHYSCFEDALYDWERRKERINYNRLFRKMAINVRTKEDVSNIHKNLDEFRKLESDNKICFWFESDEKNDIVSLPYSVWERNSKINKGFPNNIAYSANSIKQLAKQVDILKLLCGEKNYIRARNI